MLQKTDFRAYACRRNDEVTGQFFAVLQNQGAYIAPGIQTGPACPGCQPEAASVVFKESLVLRRSFGIQLEGKDPVGHLHDYRGDSPLHKGIGCVHAHQAGADYHCPGPWFYGRVNGQGIGQIAEAVHIFCLLKSGYGGQKVIGAGSQEKPVIGEEGAVI